MSTLWIPHVTADRLGLPAPIRGLYDSYMTGACRMLSQYPNLLYPGSETSLGAFIRNATLRSLCQNTPTPIPPIPNQPNSYVGAGVCDALYNFQVTCLTAIVTGGTATNYLTVVLNGTARGSIKGFRHTITSPYGYRVFVIGGQAGNPNAVVETQVGGGSGRQVMEMQITSLTRNDGQPDNCSVTYSDLPDPIPPIDITVNVPDSGGWNLPPLGLAVPFAIIRNDLSADPTLNFDMGGVDVNLTVDGVEFNWEGDETGGLDFDWDRLQNALDDVRESIESDVADVAEDVANVDSNVTETGAAISDDIETSTTEIKDYVDYSLENIRCLVERVQASIAPLKLPLSTEDNVRTISSGESTPTNKVFYASFSKEVRLVKLVLNPIKGKFNGRIYKLNETDDEMEGGYGTSCLTYNSNGVSRYSNLQHLVTWFWIAPGEPWDSLRISLKAGIQFTVSVILDDVTDTIGEYAEENIPPCQGTP